ncbi:retrovirus-related pol polyprotein from transposon TNT 1-94 [Tanacetum coccineum]
MDLCGPMRVESINGTKYVLVIVDDYSRYTWNHFLRSKDETPDVLIDFLGLVQRGLHAQGILLSQEHHVSSDPVPQCPTTALEQDSLSPNPQNTPPLIIQTTSKTTSQAPTQAPTITTNENIIQAETNNEYAQVDKDEFINVFSTLVQERGETSSRYVDSSNMLTFYQRHPFEHRWTKDHPSKQVIGNPSQLIRT